MLQISRGYCASQRKYALMSQMGQTEKNSLRAYVFRFATELGHWPMQSALRICANSDMARTASIVEAGCHFQGIALRFVMVDPKLCVLLRHYVGDTLHRS